MLLLHVPMRDVHVLQGGVVVVVSVRGEQVSPILSLMQVVRDVIVLMAMLQGLMLMMSLLPRHARSPLSCPTLDPFDRPYIGRWSGTNRDGLAGWHPRPDSRSIRSKPAR